MPSRKLQFVIDERTDKLLDEISVWTKEDNKSDLIRQSIKDLHWRLSEQRKGRQIISRPVEAGVTVFDLLLPISGKAD